MLPRADAIIEWTREQARSHEQLGHWKAAADVYMALFRTAETFPAEDDIRTKATVLLVEYLRAATDAIELRKAQSSMVVCRTLVEAKPGLHLMAGSPMLSASHSAFGTRLQIPVKADEGSDWSTKLGACRPKVSGIHLDIPSWVHGKPTETPPSKRLPL